MAKHGRSRREQVALMQRIGLGLAFLVVVAVVPALLVTLPGRDDDRSPGAAPAPATTTRSAPATTPAPTGTPAPTTAGRTTPKPPGGPARTTTVPAPAGGVRLPVAAPVATGPLPPQTSYQEFPSVCGVAGRGAQPVPPRASVAGDWFGVAPGTTGTSCLYGTDRSRYWVPAVLEHGTALRPQQVEVYYKSGIRDYRLVQPFPTGFTMLSGTLAEATANGAFASWSCGEGDAPTLPTSCPAGNRLVLRLQGPSCWDGAQLDSPDHRAHLAWPLAGRCPGGHPVPVPKLELVVFYPVPTGPLALTLATGAGSTAAFRFTDGWVPAAEKKLVRDCVNRGRRCNDQGVDPGA